MTTWAIFTDFRGVLLCKPVDLFLDVWEKVIPAQTAVRDWRGRITTSARPERTDQREVFNESHYSREHSHPDFPDKPPKGFEFKPARRYMVENRWGVVDVLLFINNHQLGEKIDKLLSKLSPEGHGDNSKRLNDAKPHPETELLVDEIIMIRYRLHAASGEDCDV